MALINFNEYKTKPQLDCYLMHVDSMETHFCRGKLRGQCISSHVGTTVSHTKKIKWEKSMVETG